MILYFLKKHFDDKDNLILPLHPLKIETTEEELAALFCEDDFKKDYLILNREIRALGYNIPPLVNAYMSLSPTMKLFGTAINYGFGDVEETGILIAVDEILESKRVRHIDSFIKEHPEALKITSGANNVIYKERAWEGTASLPTPRSLLLRCTPTEYAEFTEASAEMFSHGIRRIHRSF